MTASTHDPSLRRIAGDAANRAIAAALAEALRVPRRAVTLDPGARGRRKVVRVDGDPVALELALRRLARAGAGR